MKVEMKDRHWQNGNGISVQIGKVNDHGQKCCGHRGVLSSDFNQYAYKVECTYCGYVYGANGSDMHERLRLACQGGAMEIRFWQIQEG